MGKRSPAYASHSQCYCATYWCFGWVGFVGTVERVLSAYAPLARRYGATLSPFERFAFIAVAESGACRAVARAARAGESE